MSTLPAIYLFVLLYVAYQKPSFFGITVRGKVNAQVPVPTGVNHAPLFHGPPVHLVIPAIHVDAAINPMGVTSDGAMEVPDSIVDVGWYKYGSRPGENGSAVIAGHVDGKKGEPGVFADLHSLVTDDSITIEDDKGMLSTFVVRKIRTYDPNADTSEVFNRQGGTHLNLITCEGVWDASQKTYTKRLIVFADLVK